VFDPKVLIKKEYLEQRYRAGISKLNGNTWYKLQAQRAVNQAIGRVIRHVSDYGAIVLMDERFTNFEISRWLNECKVQYNSVNELESDLATFFKANCPDWKPS
jgi:regulator of telomere elongation helicase 1